MIKTSLTCSIIMAGAFVVTGNPANAQSVDETVSYIQGRCVNSTVLDGDRRHSFNSFNVQNGIMSWSIGVVGQPWTTILNVPLADVSLITHTDNKITIHSSRRSIAWVISDIPDVTNYNTVVSTYCPNADRIVRALEHLVSLEGDDPFAN